MGWWACPASDAVHLDEHVQSQRAAIMETCTADLMQHTQMKSDHAWNMKTWECFPAAKPDFEPDFSKRSFRLSHPPVFFLFFFFFFPLKGWTAICSHPENMVRFLLRLQSQKILSSCRSAGWRYWILLRNTGTDSSKRLWRPSLRFC